MVSWPPGGRNIFPSSVGGIQSEVLLSCYTHLQCTTIIPECDSSYERTFRRNEIMGLARVGTPWSGHAVKWNCLTCLVSSSCKMKHKHQVLKETKIWPNMAKQPYQYSKGVCEIQLIHYSSTTKSYTQSSSKNSDRNSLHCHGTPCSTNPTLCSDKPDCCNMVYV